ncbi:MAG: glycosyltransferase [Deferribacterales bacterium]
MKIIHIDTGKEWRGGQRQAQFLHEGLLESGFQSILVCNEEGQFPKRGIESIVPMKFKGETDLSFMRELKKLIRKEKPDIVHTHDAHSLTPALLTKVMGTNFKLINTRRVDFSVNKGYFSRKKYDNRQVDIVVAISRAIRDMLINDGISRSKIRLINSGVRFPKAINYELYRKLIEKYELYGKYVIGNVANISDHKDQKTLIDAFIRFRSEAENAVLVIVGGGPLYAEIKAYAEATPYNSSIIFTGHTENVYEHIALFDIFCMSSKTEGLCTSIIDAMFMMRPVAATAAGGIPELVKNNFNGLLTQVKDAEALSESFNLMYDDRSIADKFSSNGFHTALKFSDNAMVSGYIRLYEELSRT